MKSPSGKHKMMKVRKRKSQITIKQKNNIWQLKCPIYSKLRLKKDFSIHEKMSKMTYKQSLKVCGKTRGTTCEKLWWCTLLEMSPPAF